MKVPVTYTQV